MFKASLPSGLKGECIIEKRIDWLYKDSEKLKNDKIFDMPRSPSSADTYESNLIEEYFKTDEKEDSKINEGREAEEEKSERNMKVLSESVVDIEDHCAENKKDISVNKKEEESIKEWIIID